MNPDIPTKFTRLLMDRPAAPLLTRDFPRHGTSGAEWLEVLPKILLKSLRRWDLTVDSSSPSPVRTGSTAIVIDVTTQDGSQAVLKVSWPFLEGAFEHLALREWDGQGMVRLEAAEPKDYALLLERLDAGRELAGESILEACEVIGTLITALDRPASPRFDTLVDRSLRWESEFSLDHPRVPRRLLTQALSHLRDLVAGLDEERVRAWRFVRLVQNAVWAAGDGDHDFLTRSIFLAKMFDQ